MEIKIGNQTLPLDVDRHGRMFATFQATEDTDYIELLSDCIGTFKIKNIQLEEGDTATTFVEPKVTETDISGIFKDLHHLDIRITDEVKGLTNQITINQDGLEQLVEDTKRGLNSRITSTADVWQQELNDTERNLSNKITATADLWQVNLKNEKDNLENTIQASADSLVTLIKETDSDNFSRTEQLVNGLQSTVNGQLTSQRTQLENLITSSIEDKTGSRSLIWQTLTSHGAQIINNDDDISTLTQTAQGLQSRVSDAEGNITKVTQTANGLSYDINDFSGKLQTQGRRLEGLIQDKVTRGDVQSIIGQSGDSIWLQIRDKVANTTGNMTGEEIVSALNITGQGVRISGRLIHLEGNTLIDDGLIKRAHISDGSINNAKIANGTIGSAKIAYLDVNKLSGNTSEFVRTQWNAINSSMTADGSGLHIKSTENWSLDLTRSGMSINEIDGSLMASVVGFIDTSMIYDHRADGAGIALIAEYGNSIDIGSRQTHRQGTFHSDMSISGTTGRIYINSPICINSPIFPDSSEGHRVTIHAQNRGGISGVFIGRNGGAVPKPSGIWIANNGSVNIVHMGNFYGFNDVVEGLNLKPSYSF